MLNPKKTALVVIDLDLGTGRNDPSLVAAVAGHVNALSKEVRSRGGTVAWVTTPIARATENFRAVFGEEQAQRYENDTESGKSKALWPELIVEREDIHATKQGHSAFFPGRSDLHAQLQSKDIESLLIVGAVTNVCCEASARDAAELQYKVTIISDAVVGWSRERDEATFATFFRCYGDVRPTDDAIRLLEK